MAKEGMVKDGAPTSSGPNRVTSSKHRQRPLTTGHSCSPPSRPASWAPRCPHGARSGRTSRSPTWRNTSMAPSFDRLRTAQRASHEACNRRPRLLLVVQAVDCGVGGCTDERRVPGQRCGRRSGTRPARLQLPMLFLSWLLGRREDHRGAVLDAQAARLSLGRCHAPIARQDVHGGCARTPGTAMQSYASILSEREIASVVEFVRTTFILARASNTQY